MVTVLVCGGRDYSRTKASLWLWDNAIAEISATLHLWRPTITTVLHGAARGADEGADDWARNAKIHRVKFPADWKTHGKTAGPIRNQRMIDEGKPDVVIAFPGGRGTADMIRRAEDNGIPVIRVRDGE